MRTMHGLMVAAVVIPGWLLGAGGEAKADSVSERQADPVTSAVGHGIGVAREILDDIICVIDPTALRRIGSATGMNFPGSEPPPLWRCDPGSRPPTGSG